MRNDLEQEDPASRTGRRLAAGLVISLAAGCSRSPTVSIFGSFFPSWLLFAVSGVIFAFVVRAMCVARQWDLALPAPVFFYLTCAVAFTFATYWAWIA